MFEKRLRETAMAMPLMCCGADMLGVPSRTQVIVVGHKASDEFDKMLAAAHSSYNPNKTVSHIRVRYYFFGVRQSDGSRLIFVSKYFIYG